MCFLFCLLILKSTQSNLSEGQLSMFCAHLYSLVLVHVYKRMYGSIHDTLEWMNTWLLLVQLWKQCSITWHAIILLVTQKCMHKNGCFNVITNVSMQLQPQSFELYNYCIHLYMCKLHDKATLALIYPSQYALKWPTIPS